MNRDPITLILAVLLVVSSMATAGLCYWYLQCTRQAQQAQAEAARVNQNRTLMQSLAAETFEYAKRNPAILPVMENLGWRVQTNAAQGGVK
jgi:flagellar basal body-associated protein FliL